MREWLPSPQGNFLVLGSIPTCVTCHDSHVPRVTHLMRRWSYCTKGGGSISLASGRTKAETWASAMAGQATTKKAVLHLHKIFVR